MIVLAQCHTEYDRRDVFEAMDPFFPFAALTAHIEHAVASISIIRPEQWGWGGILYAELAHRKPALIDTGGLRSRTKNIIHIWDVIRGSDPLGFIEETRRVRFRIHIVGGMGGALGSYYGAESIR